MTEESAENVRRDLQRLQPIVEQIVGVSSRWNGTVEVVDTDEFRGKKPFSCSIIIQKSLVTQDLRWRTLIHELLHSVSEGYNSSDYNACIGWEEGVIEQLQRLYRGEILTQLGVIIAEDIFQAAERIQGYNRYIVALETIRELLDISERSFYRNLLLTPIKERQAWVMARAPLSPASARHNFVRAFSVSNAVLKRGRQ